MDEGEITVFREDEKKILIGEQEHLTIAIASALPDALAVFEIDTGENAGVEAVGVAFVNDRVVEVGLERQRGPAGIDGPPVGTANGVDAASAFGLRGADENAAAGDESGLDDGQAFPFVGPIWGACCGIEAGGALGREDEDLIDAPDGGEVGRTVAVAYGFAEPFEITGGGFIGRDAAGIDDDEALGDDRGGGKAPHGDADVWYRQWCCGTRCVAPWRRRAH